MALLRPADGPRPLKFLAWLGERQVDPEAWAHRCRSLYRRRWGAEDAIRFLKSEVSLERVRVMSWRALEHMMNLAAFTMTLIALIAREPVEWLTELVRVGGPRRTEVAFLFYRIRPSLSHLLPLNPVLPSEA